MSYGYQGPPGMPYPGQMPQNMMGAPPGAAGASPYPTNSGTGYNLPPGAPGSGMPQPFASYPSSTYPPNQQQPSIPYSQYGGQQPPIGQPQQYQMQQNIPPSSYPQPQNTGYSQGPYPAGNPSYPTTQAPYPSHPAPNQPNAAGYPGHFVPFDTSSGPYQGSTGAFPQNPTSFPSSSFPQHSSTYPGTHIPGGQGMEPTYSQHVTTTSFAPQHAGSASHQVQAQTKPSPTVLPAPNFNPQADASALRTAMKGWGTDEKAIINVLANRTNAQRQEIAMQFKTMHGKDLIKDLKSELSGNFEALIVAMMTPLPEYYAKELHHAMSGMGTDECVLIEVLCSLPNYEIHRIQQAYGAMYGRNLEDDLRSETSGHFERLMVSLCCANRDESTVVNPAAAQQDAQELYNAGELQFGTDESTFNKILVQRSIVQLQQIFAEYERIAHHGIETAIDKEFSGDIKKGLLAIVKCVKNRPGFFAEQLYKSMKGGGTQDGRLIRLVVTRSEIDMKDIKQAFVQEYHQSLESFISDDCSGDYKKCLLALIS